MPDSNRCAVSNYIRAGGSCFQVANFPEIGRQPCNEGVSTLSGCESILQRL
jgi:hypothetical protein